MSRKIGEFYYKGHIGSIEASEVANTYYGQVEDTKDLVSYEGSTLEELYADFCGAIDDWEGLNGE